MSSIALFFNLLNWFTRLYTHMSLLPRLNNTTCPSSVSPSVFTTLAISHFSLSSVNNLRQSDAVLGSGKNSIGTTAEKGQQITLKYQISSKDKNSPSSLSTSLKNSKILGSRNQALALKVSEESLDVSVKVVNSRRRDKRVDSSVAVGARVQLEGVTTERDGVDGGTRAGDGAGVVVGKPDHNLVLGGAAGGGGGEEVEGDVCDDGAGVGVRPVPGGDHFVDGVELLAGEVQGDVCVGFDGSAAGPCPA